MQDRIVQTIRTIHDEATSNPERHLYLLLDPALEEFPAAGREETHQTVRIWLKHPDIPDSKEPRLLEIPLLTTGEFLLHDSVERSMQEVLAESRTGHKVRSICAWYVSEDTAEELAAAISWFAWRNIDHQRRLIRCWDPRVLLALPDIAQLSCIPLNGVTGICFFLDWQGNLVHRELAGSPQDEATWNLARLLDLGLHNRLMQLSDLLAGKSWRDVSRNVWQAIDLARELGASNEDDLYRLTRDLTQHGELIRHSSEFLSIITSMKQHPGGYGALTSELDADDWTRMRSDGAKNLAPNNA